MYSVDGHLIKFNIFVSWSITAHIHIQFRNPSSPQKPLRHTALPEPNGSNQQTANSYTKPIPHSSHLASQKKKEKSSISAITATANSASPPPISARAKIPATALDVNHVSRKPLRQRRPRARRAPADGPRQSRAGPQGYVIHAAGGVGSRRL